MRNLIQKLRIKAQAMACRAAQLVKDDSGEVGTNFLGGILAALAVIAFLIAAINTAFPTLFSTMFANLSTRLNSLLPAAS